MTSAPGSPAGAAPAASPGSEATNDDGGRFRAPHRRGTSGPRVREKARGRGVSRRARGCWAGSRSSPSVRVGGWISDVLYRLWPEKRRYVRANAARILALPSDDPRVDALGRAVFRNQVRWVIEGMHLIRMTNAEHVADVHGRGPGSPPRSVAGIEQRDPGRAPHRERGGRGGRARGPRLAGSLPGRRHGLRRALRALRRPATSLGHRGHPLAQPARGLPRPAQRQDPRAPRGLGLPTGWAAGPLPGRVDHAAVRPGRPRRADRCDHRPLLDHPPAGRHLPRRDRRRPSSSPPPSRPRSRARRRPSPTPSRLLSAKRRSSGASSSRCGPTTRPKRHAWPSARWGISPARRHPRRA